jgi:hypothetical protein
MMMLGSAPGKRYTVVHARELRVQELDARKQKRDEQADQPARSDNEKLCGSDGTAHPQPVEDAPSSAALNLLVSMLWEVRVLSLTSAGQTDENARVRREVLHHEGA